MSSSAKTSGGGGSTYYDSVVVYPEDAQSLQPGQWLRSNILAFYFAHLQRQYSTASSGTNKGSGPSIVFLDTSVAQCMHFFKQAELGPVSLFREADVLLIPLSDYDAEMWGAGYHWSLLRIFIERKALPTTTTATTTAATAATTPSQKKQEVVTSLRCKHLDSLPHSGCSSHGKNEDIAAHLCTLLTQWYTKQNMQLVSASRSAAAAVDVEVDFAPADGKHPRQINSYDCGCYVCAAAEQFATARVYPTPAQLSRTVQQQQKGDDQGSLVPGALRGDLLQDPSFEDLTPKHCNGVRTKASTLLQQLRK